MHMQSMNGDHDVFWRDNQIVVAFHSNIPLVDDKGVNNGDLILRTLNLDAQLGSLNQFLKEQNINYTLSFPKELKTQASDQDASEVKRQVASSRPPAGTHLFGLGKEIQSEFGKVQTSIISLFDFNMDMGAMPAPDTGTQMQSMEPVPVVKIVNGLNAGLVALNKRDVPIGAASPNFLCGGTPSNTQGCPLTPPIPIEDNCALWRFNFPELTPEALQTMTGKDVTVFILDAIPDRTTIQNAAAQVADDNLLLLDVDAKVTFNYAFPVGPILVPATGGGMEPVKVGKDVYGEHFAMIMPDHGLFIAGIVHDIAPDAQIECIRVLNEYCVGDLDVLTQALEYIANRMLPGNNLYQRPVVVNLSLVLPTKDELEAQGMVINQSGLQNNPYISLLRQIQSLVDMGAIIVASAGNEGDIREMPQDHRPDALYPAAFANAPELVEGVIPVGAVDSTKAVTYSCYPGSHGIATYGGKIPDVTPPAPDPANPPIVTQIDAVRGIYSANNYPPLIATSSAYAPPNSYAWAYWVGTSFAAPIISALAARVLDWKLQGGPVSNVYDVLVAAANSNTVTWDNLDASTTGSTTIAGPMILATQQCTSRDTDDLVVVTEVEITSVVVEE